MELKLLIICCGHFLRKYLGFATGHAVKEEEIGGKIVNKLVTTQEKARDVWGKKIFIENRRKKKIPPWERREGKTIK